MGATLLDGVVVEKHAMVAAGALVRQNTRIPSGEVCLKSLLLTLFIYVFAKNIGSLNKHAKEVAENLDLLQLSLSRSLTLNMFYFVFKRINKKMRNSMSYDCA